MALGALVAFVYALHTMPPRLPVWGVVGARLGHRQVEGPDCRAWPETCAVNPPFLSIAV